MISTRSRKWTSTIQAYTKSSKLCQYEQEIGFSSACFISFYYDLPYNSVYISNVMFFIALVSLIKYFFNFERFACFSLKFNWLYSRVRKLHAVHIYFSTKINQKILYWHFISIIKQNKSQQHHSAKKHSIKCKQLYK